MKMKKEKEKLDQGERASKILLCRSATVNKLVEAGCGGVGARKEAPA